MVGKDYLEACMTSLDKALHSILAFKELNREEGQAKLFPVRVVADVLLTARHFLDQYLSEGIVPWEGE